MRVKIIFSKSDKVFSRIIRFFTAGFWSHCGIVDFNKVVDASAILGVSSSPYSTWVLNRSVEVVSVSIDPEKKEAADKWLADQIGLKYDFKFIRSLFNPFRDNPVYIDGKKQFRCNELVYKYLIRCGVEELDQDWIFRSSPESLYQILKTLNYEPTN